MKLSEVLIKLGNSIMKEQNDLELSNKIHDFQFTFKATNSELKVIRMELDVIEFLGNKTLH